MIRIQGHSGCALQILHDDKKSRYFVRKSIADPDYCFRLHKQCIKQQRFKFNSFIETPEIYTWTIRKDYFHFDMRYFNGYDFLTFLQIADKKRLDSICSILIEFILKNLDSSIMTKFPEETFRKKISETSQTLILRKDIDQQKLNSYFNYLLSFSSDALFPAGYCHGDLTLSNLLVYKLEDKLMVIDFLDTFLDSPIQDYVKIRQDTQFFWSLLLFSGNIDVTKTKLAFEYMDKRFKLEIEEKFNIEIFYKPFQILSLLRVLKYTTEEHMIKFLYSSIDQLMEK